jgi:hypothetical protein
LADLFNQVSSGPPAACYHLNVSGFQHPQSLRATLPGQDRGWVTLGNQVGGLDTRARALLDVLVLNGFESRVVGVHE